MNRTEMIRQLQSEYQAQRQRDEQALDERLAQAVRLDPEIGRLREENQNLALDTLRRMATVEDVAARTRAAQNMKARGIANNDRIRQRLKALGLPEDALNMQYRCPLCRDTGLVGEAPSRFCECFLARLNKLQFEDGSMAGAGEQCFARFDEARIPEEDGQRMQLNNARLICEAYADSFPQTKYLNLLFTGASGLGKTFLLNSIYARVVERGFVAVRITAFRMFETMRRQHFANSAEERDFDELIEAPLLLIDDLGTEPMMRNITVEYLQALLSERIAARRHTVIATNLSPLQLQDVYGERISARLLDCVNCATLSLTGKDIRKQ